MRFLHFSDIHVDTPLARVPLRKWFSKRVLGGIHLAIGRGRLFADAPRKLEALVAFARESRVDAVIFSGDYTALGLDPEFERARSAVEPLISTPAGFVNVPGNHDLYVPHVVRARRFEHFFGDTLGTDAPEHAVEGPWPLVRLIGDDVAVVAVDSSRPNPPWRSTGRIPEPQLAALRVVLRDERVRGRFVFVVTHYAPCLADGGPDRRLHRLDNADAFLDACSGVERGAILCGHVHHRFHVRPAGSPLPVFCAGSTTIDGREGAWLFDVDGSAAVGTPVAWDGGRYDTGTPVELWP
jgi:3',5'-cyclic AMP phosphodiesterase CpdA